LEGAQLLGEIVAFHFPLQSQDTQHDREGTGIGIARLSVETPVVALLGNLRHTFTYHP